MYLVVSFLLSKVLKLYTRATKIVDHCPTLTDSVHFQRIRTINSAGPTQKQQDCSARVSSLEAQRERCEREAAVVERTGLLLLPSQRSRRLRGDKFLPGTRTGQ